MSFQYPSGLRALNHRDYRLFFFGQMVSLIGTWMQTVGQSWLIVTLTNSALLLSLISTLQFLPQLLFSLFGGALADRLPKRKTIFVTQATMMLLAFALSALVYTGTVRYWHVAVLATLLGLANSIDMPVRQAFTVEMIGGKQDLGNAIALNSAVFNGARLLGPAVSGLLVAKYGVGLAFFINGISFVAVLISLMQMNALGLPKPRPKKSIFHDIMEGLRYVFKTPTVFFLISLLLGIGLFVINYGVLVTVLASKVLGKGAQEYGILMSSLGAGALVGAVILAMRGRDLTKPKLTPLVISGIVLCTVTTLMFFVHLYALACVGLFAMGLSQILYTADTNTTLQVVVPDELRGRVMSVYQLVFAGSTPIGSLFTGAVIERWGGSAGFLADGGLGLLSAVALIAWFYGRRKRNSDGNTAAVEA